MKALVVLLALCLNAASVFAQIDPAYDPANYATVLVPLNVYDSAHPLNGENGSVWESSLVVRNAADRPVWFNQQGPLCITEDCGGVAKLDPGEIVPVQLSRSTVEGALLHVEKAEAEYVFFEMRLSSPGAMCNADVSVPVVRESRFLNSRYEFLDVPLALGTRVMLRVFDVSGRPEGSDARVVVTDASGSALLDTVVHAHFSQDPPEIDGFPGFPNYGALAHLESYAVHPEQRVTVTITPSTPGMRYWALISITDDLTQGVRLISPN